MAKLPDLQLKGTAGGMILYVRNGKQCMRSKPTKVANPRTQAQTQKRSQFGAISKFASSVLRNLIHPYWNPVARKQKRTGYNLFINTNLPAFTDGLIQPEKLLLCPENGLKKENFRVTLENHILQIQWESSIYSKKAGREDQLCLLLLSPKGTLSLKENLALRSAQRAELELSTTTNQSIFAFWRRKESYSESAWLWGDWLSHE
jgi:hypothetical protein